MKCQNKNVIYFLKCSSGNYSTTYIGKTVDLRSRMNNHITSCRLGGLTEKFDKPRILLDAEPEARTVFSYTYVYEIKRRAEFTIL